MQHRDLKTLALLGLTSGLLIAPELSAEFVQSPSYPAAVQAHCKSCNAKSVCKKTGGCASLTADTDPEAKKPYANPSDPSSAEDQKKNDPNDGNLNYKLMTEQELLLELNDEGRNKYQSLTPEGKALALKVASGACGGTNQCKGLNACKTDKNDCAGKGSCVGKGICAFSDKNLAVKVVYDKMQAKRQNLTK